LTGGWQLNSNLLLRTGRPVNIRAASASSGTLEGTERANIVGDPFQGTDHTFVKGQSLRWFTPAAFVNPPSEASAACRKIRCMDRLRGGGPFGFQEYPIKERLKAQFRVEMFNILNHVTWRRRAPGGQLAGTDRLDSRSLVRPAGIGPGEPFNVQLALKILF